MTTDYKATIEDRLIKAENEAEQRRDQAEAEIIKLVGELSTGTLFRLRGLFQEWEEADNQMGEIAERLQRLN